MIEIIEQVARLVDYEGFSGSAAARLWPFLSNDSQDRYGTVERYAEKHRRQAIERAQKFLSALSAAGLVIMPSAVVEAMKADLRRFAEHISAAKAGEFIEPQVIKKAMELADKRCGDVRHTRHWWHLYLADARAMIAASSPDHEEESK